MAGKIRGVMCPKCKEVIFGRDGDGCTVAQSREQEEQMSTGRFVCPTLGCGQKVELQGPGGYKGSHWVPVEQFTEN
jgi:hypothetical protein